MPPDFSPAPPPLPTPQPVAAAADFDDAGATAQRQLVLAAARARHWQRCTRLTSLLLLAWLATTFCSAFFARELAGLTVFGWPLSFYLAAQGAALIYLAILAVYALAMGRYDRDFRQRDDHPGGTV
ncbi:MAG: hypothetical protein JWP59_457 [Massilia sp.]|jgi:putative solute:sodium symporter small subunit|nr:hypothetical protein [Massilia sp.]